MPKKLMTKTIQNKLIELSGVNSWSSRANITDGSYAIELKMHDCSTQNFETANRAEWQEMLEFEKSWIEYRIQQITEGNN